MKTLIRFILAALLVQPALAVTLYTVDTTTVSVVPVTNTAMLTVTNKGWTNENYTVVNTNNVVVGDPLRTAFNKVNSNFQAIAALVVAPATTATNISGGALNQVTNIAQGILNAATNAAPPLAVTNAIEKFNGTGYNPTIFNNLTLVNSNSILGYQYQSIVTISTNAAGVVSTNTFTVNPNTGTLTASNGDILIPYYYDIFLPVQGQNPDGSPTNTTVPPATPSAGTINITWQQTFNGTNTGTASFDGSTWTHTGYDLNMGGPSPSGMLWSFTCTAIGQTIKEGGFTIAVNSGSPNGTYNFGPVLGYGWGDPPAVSAAFSGTVTLSGYPDKYTSVPPGFIPVIPIGQSVPLWITNMEYIVLQPVTNDCGFVTDYIVIGWNPYGSTMSGWQLYINSLGYAPAAPPPCDSVSSNYVVFKQAVWTPDICIDPNTINPQEWQRGVHVSSERLALQNVLVNSDTPPIGVNLNKNGDLETVGGTNVTLNPFWCGFYNLTFLLTNAVSFSDMDAFGFLPTTNNEPALATVPAGSYWQLHSTSVTGNTTNYQFWLHVAMTNSYTPQPRPGKLAAALTQSAPTVSPAPATNNFVIIYTTNLIATPIYANTVLNANGDTTLGINAAKPLTSYNGQLDTNLLSTNVLNLFSLMISNAIFTATNH